MIMQQNCATQKEGASIIETHLEADKCGMRNVLICLGRNDSDYHYGNYTYSKMNKTCRDLV